jgi:hypothetical protein
MDQHLGVNGPVSVKVLDSFEVVVQTNFKVFGLDRVSEVFKEVLKKCLEAERGDAGRSEGNTLAVGEVMRDLRLREDVHQVGLRVNYLSLVVHKGAGALQSRNQVGCLKLLTRLMLLAQKLCNF